MISMVVKRPFSTFLAKTVHKTHLGILLLLSLSILSACVDSPDNTPPNTGTAPNSLIATIVKPNTDVTVTAGDAVYFSADVQNADNPDDLEYFWDFGDGQTSNSLVAGIHVYNAKDDSSNSTAVSYTVTFTVTDTISNKQVSAQSRVITVTSPTNGGNTNQAPTDVAITSTPAAETNLISVNENDPIKFVGSATDPNGDTMTYTWSFPGASPGSGAGNTVDPVSYAQAGNYTVTLTASDGQLSSSTTVNVLVTAAPPGGGNTNQAPTNVAITSTPPAVNNDISVNENDPIKFVGSATDPNGDTPTYTWSLPGASPSSAAGGTVDPVSYAQAGTYTVTLTASDGQLSSSATVNVLVSAAPPGNTNQAPTNVAITSTPPAVNNEISVNENDPIKFVGSATDPNGDKLTYTWSLPGASPSSAAGGTVDPVSYAQAGTYTVTLAASDGQLSSSTTVTIVVKAVPASDEKIITFIELNDLHANLIPHTDIQRNADGSTQYVTRGGVARIATMITDIKASNPNNNVVMNIGDTFHGGVEAFYSSGNDIVDVVNMLPIDVGVPGNWDFVYGPLITRLRFTASTTVPNFNLPGISTGALADIHKTVYPDLAANLTFVPFDQCGMGPFNPPICSEIPTIDPTWQTNIAGVEIGFIGITSDIVAKMHPVLANGMQFTQGETDYTNLINNQAALLRNGTPKADIVVVMSELGIHKDHRLADIINPGSVDIFFSAHTHELVTTPLTSNSGAIIVEAGNDTYLGRMDVHWSTTNNKINSVDWQVLPVETSITEDTVIAEKITNTRARYLSASGTLATPLTDPSVYPSGQTLNQSINTVLTTTNRGIFRHHSLENSFNNLITDLLRNAYSTDIAMTPGFRFDTVLEGSPTIAKEITLEDVYRFIPVAYTVATANVSGQRLKQVIEQNLTEVYSTTIFNQAGGWMNGYSGLSMDVNLTAGDGNRVSGLTLNNAAATPIAANGTYSIAGCVRPFDTATICSYDGFTSVANTGLTMIDFFTQQLSNGNIANIAERQDIHDSSNTLLWPQSEYYQPINGATQ